MKVSRFTQSRPVRIRGVIATLKSPSGDEIQIINNYWKQINLKFKDMKTVKKILKGIVILVLFVVTLCGLAADTYWLLWLVWVFLIMPIYEGLSLLIDRI